MRNRINEPLPEETKQGIRHIYGKYVEWGFLRQKTTPSGELAWSIVFDDEDMDKPVTFVELAKITEKLTAVLTIYHHNYMDVPDKEKKQFKKLWIWVKAFLIIAEEVKAGFKEYWDLVMETHHRFHEEAEIKEFFKEFESRLKDEPWLDRNIRI